MAHLHGYEIKGEPQPPLLSPGPGPRGSIIIEPCGEDSILAGRGDLTLLLEDDRGVAFAMARCGDRFVVWGRNRGSFEGDPRGLRVRTSPGADEAAWSHQLATVVIPLMLAERGAPALHASGVATDSGAVIFSGASGRGKSTTTVLATAHGLAPLADDAVVLAGGDGGPREVYAAGRALWATPRAAAAAAGTPDRSLPDARRDRRIHRTSAPQRRGPVPVAALVALEPREEELSVSSLAPAEALQKLVPALLHVGDRAALQQSFSALAAALEVVPAWSVAMPEGLEAAREAVPALLETVIGSRPLLEAADRPL